MQKQLTVTLEDEVYEGLLRVVGRENISQFINGLVQPHVVKSDLEAGYRAMAADEAREAEVTARVAAIDEGYGMFAGRGRSVDDFLADRHAEGEAEYLESGYRAMAADEAREAEALEWSEALIGDADEKR